MRYPKGTPAYGRKGCCPTEWEATPNITGCFELDAVIRRNANNSIPDRLHLYCGNRATVYGNRTGYHGYTKDADD